MDFQEPAYPSRLYRVFFFISCALPNDPWSKVLVQYKNPFQELISIGCASLRTYTPYHMCD